MLQHEKASGHGKEIVYVRYDTTDTRVCQLLPLLVIKESMSPAFNKTRRHKVEQEMREFPFVMETQPTCINGSMWQGVRGTSRRDLLV